MVELEVRKYIKEDKQAVQDICYLTGYMGDNIEHFWRHKPFFRPGTAGFLWRGAFDTTREKQVAKDDFFDERWPSHLHINMLPIARGTGLGSALMKSG